MAESDSEEDLIVGNAPICAACSAPRPSAAWCLSSRRTAGQSLMLRGKTQLAGLVFGPK
jgi:hypothetical protein